MGHKFRDILRYIMRDICFCEIRRLQQLRNGLLTEMNRLPQRWYSPVQCLGKYSRSRPWTSVWYTVAMFIDGRYRDYDIGLWVIRYVKFPPFRFIGIADTFGSKLLIIDNFIF